ncbi:MAG: flagellar biosynthesis protein FlgJ [Deltaproteobacteria bacterium]|nr:MAG: flagellar biosynthesis protein FlgJ [Deltaproteobacteria bacterium]
MLEKIEPGRSSLTGLGGNTTDKNLREVCVEFESIFLAYMLKSMKRTVPESSLIGKSNGSKIISSMYDNNLALGLAKGGGIGLAETICRRLSTEKHDEQSIS